MIAEEGIDIKDEEGVYSEEEEEEENINIKEDEDVNIKVEVSCEGNSIMLYGMKAEPD